MRCLIETSQWPADAPELAPAESRRLLRVMRAQPGERVGLFTGRGHTADAVLEAASGGRARLRVIEGSRREAPPPAVSVTLFQAVPKHALMDAIIQKATELGVRTIAPLMTERVIVRLAPRDAARRLERWQAIALEAVRQCGRAWLPEVLPLRTLEAAAAAAAATGFDLLLAGALGPEARPLREALEPVRGRPVLRLGLVIGPEGDLTEAEHAAFRAAGAVPVSFGPRVLRVETAALYGLSVLQYECGSAG